MVVWCWSVKGGVGTSVVAATVALRAGATGRDTVLVDLGGDQPPILGCDRPADPTGRGLSDWIDAGDAVAADAIARLLEDVAPRVRLLPCGSRPVGPGRVARIELAVDLLARGGTVVVDAGLLGADTAELWNRPGSPARSLCVLRPCYLALRRAVRSSASITDVVLVDEPGRALRGSDVRDAVGASSIQRVPWDPRIARAVDAGTFPVRLPSVLRRLEVPG